MNGFIALLIYLIGIPITWAIAEDNKYINCDILCALFWPIISLFILFVILLYPFYWITKQIKNKIKK